MSRVDPISLVQAQPDQGLAQGIRPPLSPLDIATKQAALADTQSQIQARQLQALNLSQQMAQTRSEFNARQQVNQLLATNPTADVGQLLQVGGTYAIPAVKDILDQRKAAIEAKAALIDQTTKQLANHDKMVGDLADAAQSSATNFNDDGSPIWDDAANKTFAGKKADLVQQYVNEGVLTPDQANAMLASHVSDDVAQMKAAQALISKHQTALSSAATAAEAQGKAAESQANALKAQAEIGGYPLNADDANKRIAALGLKPEDSQRFKAQVAALTNPNPSSLKTITDAATKYADQAALIQTEAPAKIAEASAQGAATAAAVNAAKNTNPYIQNVNPNLQEPAVKDYGAEQTRLRAINAATTNLDSAINLALKGGKEAASIAPLLGVQAINQLAGMKRLNPSELQSYGNAGSLVDNIEGWIGKKAEGEPIPPNILKDMQTLHDTLASNAALDFQGRVADINGRYQSTFPTAPPGTANAVKVQQNSKGEYRYSTDGGKTWNPGKPPNQ